MSASAWPIHRSYLDCKPERQETQRKDGRTRPHPGVIPISRCDRSRAALSRRAMLPCASVGHVGAGTVHGPRRAQQRARSRRRMRRRAVMRLGLSPRGEVPRLLQRHPGRSRRLTGSRLLFRNAIRTTISKKHNDFADSWISPIPDSAHLARASRRKSLWNFEVIRTASDRADQTFRRDDFPRGRLLPPCINRPDPPDALIGGAGLLRFTLRWRDWGRDAIASARASPPSRATTPGWTAPGGPGRIPGASNETPPRSAGRRPWRARSMQPTAPDRVRSRRRRFAKSRQRWSMGLTGRCGGPV